MVVDIHADDYGYTLNTSKEMLSCVDSLDSISIICNTSYFDESMELFYQAVPDMKKLPKLAVHLNIVEGYSYDGSILDKGWGYYFLNSFTPKRGMIKEAVKKELKYQIDKVNKACLKCFELADKYHIPYSQRGIRIDSHTHTHPVPVVWEALCEVIDENEYDIEFIRNPKEPLMPFLKELSLYRTYSPVNFIKNFILNVLSGKIDRYADKLKISKVYMCGLVMSGHMDYERLNKVYDAFCAKAERDGRYMEFLFHPGKALKSEESLELSRENMGYFNESDNREIERDAVLRIKPVIE